jgi:hypothetical protein
VAVRDMKGPYDQGRVGREQRVYRQAFLAIMANGVLDDKDDAEAMEEAFLTANVEDPSSRLGVKVPVARTHHARRRRQVG